MSDVAKDFLTSTEYNDVTGCVTVNAVDALMAIAGAINRLAAVQELSEQRHEEYDRECREAYDAVNATVADNKDGDKPGHA